VSIRGSSFRALQPASANPVAHQMPSVHAGIRKRPHVPRRSMAGRVNAGLAMTGCNDI
jgi:hypothetical protein